ncbi:hypothetical protein D9M70_419550 [compost metagenome]
MFPGTAFVRHPFAPVVLNDRAPGQELADVLEEHQLWFGGGAPVRRLPGEAANPFAHRGFAAGAAEMPAVRREPEAAHALPAGDLQRVQCSDVGAEVVGLWMVHLMDADGHRVVVGGEVRLPAGLLEVALGGASVAGEQVAPEAVEADLGLRVEAVDVVHSSSSSRSRSCCSNSHMDT